MRRFLKLVFLVAFAAALAALVATAKSKKQMIAGMTDDEIRAYIDARLASRVPSDKLEQIQDAVVQGTASMRGAATVAEEAADYAADAADDAVEAAEEAVEAAEEAVIAADVADIAAEEAAEEEASS